LAGVLLTGFFSSFFTSTLAGADVAGAGVAGAFAGSAAKAVTANAVARIAITDFILKFPFRLMKYASYQLLAYKGNYAFHHNWKFSNQMT
jgi:hypothetical protein